MADVAWFSGNAYSIPLHLPGLVPGLFFDRSSVPYPLGFCFEVFIFASLYDAVTMEQYEVSEHGYISM